MKLPLEGIPFKMRASRFERINGYVGCKLRHLLFYGLNHRDPLTAIAMI